MEATKPKVTAKDFFMHIGLVASLYVFATSFLTFLFDIINYAFPDQLAYYADPYSSGIRFALSTLIVSFPILLLLLRLVYKDLVLNTAKRDLVLRRWFLYLTLFIAALTGAIDLVILLNTFLGGEISTRFLLKSLSVFIVAGGVFWAALSDLRGVFFDKPKAWKTMVGVASVIVVASVIWGFTVIGSPSTNRDLRYDAQRLSDLQNIQWQVVSHYQSKGVLPGSLADLNDSISSYMTPIDPKTEAPYEYRTITATTTLSFELCATFAKATQDLKGRGEYPGSGGSYTSDMSYPYPGSDLDNNWKHEAGRACFTRTIDPQKYPVYPRDGVKGL